LKLTHHHKNLVLCPAACTDLTKPFAGDYWGWFGSRSYHHTGPVSTFYAMREALQIVADEGLEAMWARHLARHQQLWEGLSSMGLQSYVENDADRWVGLSFGGSRTIDFGMKAVSGSCGRA
jgi:aspartate aminotransferase-like enzyme